MKRAFAAIAAIALATARPAAAQTPDAGADTLVAEGRRLLDGRRPDEAQKAFEAALKRVGKHIDAMEGMADADVLRKRWGNAADWFEDVLKRDPGRLSALYGLGVSKRELGVFTAPVLRPREWRKSEQQFLRIMEIDSTYRDVLFQYAILQRYRERYEDAVGLGLRQTAVHPDSPTGRFGLFVLYDYLIENRPWETARAWLASRGGPHDRYFLAELYRRKGRWPEADSLFQGLLARPAGFARQPVLLSLARMAVRKDAPERADALYWRAVRGVSNDFEAEFVKQDLFWVMNDDEYRTFRMRTPWPALSNAVLAFWFRRDPLPSFPYNSRLIEHYRRLVEAETHYRYDGFRSRLAGEEFAGYAGFHSDLPAFRAKAAIQRPEWTAENYKFNDMGLIYIRYGQPDGLTGSPGESLVDNQSWLYEERGGLPKRIFHFVENKPGDWNLVSGFSQLDILQNLTDWDSRYYHVLTGDEMEQVTLLNEIRLENAVAASQSLQADRQTWSDKMKPLDVMCALYRFRENERSDAVHLAYALPLAGLRKLAGRSDSLVVEAGVEVFDGQVGRVYKDTRRFSPADSTSGRLRDGVWIDEFKFDVPLASGIVAFHARVEGTEILNGWRQPLAPTDSARDRLSCSTLKTAFDIRPGDGAAARPRDRLVMVPNPLNAARLTDPLYIYYEVYNLRSAASGLTEYTVSFSLRGRGAGGNVLKRVTDLFRGSDSFKISLQNDRSGSERHVSDYVGFDVGKAAPGDYVITLSVRDKLSKQQASSSTVIRLE